MYIKSIQILKPHRCFQQDEHFDLQDITLLVGDQGCGKSTLLSGLQNQQDFLKVNLTPFGEMGVDTFFFDTEKMNPRICDTSNYCHPDGTSKGIGIGAALSARFVSHGETLINFTIDAIKTAKSCILFLDEPECALSLKNQFLLSREIKNAVTRNCQVVVATHSLVLISSMENILSLEHKQWMASDEFINCNARV